MNKLREFSPRVWHRRASKPVSVWMLVFLVAGLLHVFIPNSRWVLVHLFTLGVVTNSVVLWSQHLAEKFTQTRAPDSARPVQLRRIYILNGGIVVTVCGQLLGFAPLTQLGALIVAAMVAWHGVSLWQHWRTVAAAKRFRVIVLGYVGSAACLPVGAFLGGCLAMLPRDPLYTRLLFAHIAANVAGFVGLAAAASLTVLFPGIWRTRGSFHRMHATLALLGVGVVVAAVGALSGWYALSAAGLAVYAAGWLWSAQQWVGHVGDVLRDPRDRVNFSSVSVLAAVAWLSLTVVYFAVQLALVGEAAQLPTLPLVIGFAAQLLIGVMSYLLPTTMGGGPGAVRAGLYENWRLGLLRSTLLNGGLVLWMTAATSWLAVAAAVVCIAPLAVYPILQARAVKAQKPVLMRKATGPAAQTETPWWQVGVGVAALAVMALVFRAF